MQAASNLVVVLYVLVVLAVALAIGSFVVGFWTNYYGKMFDELGV
jgi:hypothetical protein